MRARWAAAFLFPIGCSMLVRFDDDIGSDGARDASGDAPLCGNSRIDTGEDCDDGINAETSGCPHCRFARCGDGFLRAGIEECDPAAAAGGAGCSTACLTCNGGDLQFVRNTNQHCYMRFDTAAAFADAQSACFARSAHLVTFSSMPENMEVVTALAPPGPLWMGLDDLAMDTVFRWVTDERVSFTNWSTGNPNNGGAALNEHCGTFTTDGTWDDVVCAGPLGHACEQAPWHVNPDDGHAYRAVPGGFTWAAAQTECEAQGGHLASVTSLDELNFLSTRIEGRAWIGASDVASEGAFTWVTGEPFGFTAWGTGEPSDTMAMANCVAFLVDLSAWDDVDCAGLRMALCEVDP
jgi:hypothetical protein